MEKVQFKFSAGECRTEVTDEIVDTFIKSTAKSLGVPEHLVVAQVVHWFTKQKSPLSSLLQYSIDVCADEVIGEEFYKRDQTILPFLSVCGTNNEDVKFINYVRNHKDALVCKKQGCNGTLFGECPILECEECGRQYFINIDGITEHMCKSCVSNGINTCDKVNVCQGDGAKGRHTIYMI